MGQATAGSAEGGSAEGDSAAGNSAGEAGTQGGTTQTGADGTTGTAANSGDGAGGENTNSQTGYGNGTQQHTSAEQARILHEELGNKTGEFDAMILAEQAAQRQASRQQVSSHATPGSQSDADQGMQGEGTDTGDFSTGGGMGGSSASSGSVGIPQNTAKYEPPADIPSGNHDDVVARQLREAAMREPDPELREKLWDEYRKYTGLGS